ncbi:MAG: hypothetical protein GOMPHAMPRED_005999 [Gomphillus americanus]|uniref:Methyltransferase type 11 domain-containing protein n=1 Tax=Gomphillus americanus TaxID=1940652 RepID=A0A8H3ERZ7_9LECA|nr:MAG: hypothetical protein GOMPHAMPRED_005999 [Gomphillus americanus]
MPSIRQYIPKAPNGPFPYTSADLKPMDDRDELFYSTSRFVTHIDDNAISALRKYYEILPEGRVLDFCSSWISHFPEGREALGMGMNEAELRDNPILKEYKVQDLNVNPVIPFKELDASTCTVSIDYLTRPVEVLSSLRENTEPGGSVHLAISNRCFPTKVVGRWLRVSEDQRLDMVGDYLWWSGWRNIEIQTLVQESGTDPLWIVRGINQHEAGTS